MSSWRGSWRLMKGWRHRRQPTRSDEHTAQGRIRRNQNSELMAPSALPITEILVVADCWQAEPEAEATIDRAIAAAAEFVAADIGDSELAIMLTDDAGIQTLNRNWRSIDKPTNVLSFPALQPRADDAPRMLGDIAIAYETTRREADEEAKPFGHHLSHLAAH